MSTVVLTPVEKHRQDIPPDALYEIVDGQIVEKPDMGTFSTDVALEIYFLMKVFVREQKSGWVRHEAMFTFDAERNLRRRPDVSFVSKERWPREKGIPLTGDVQVVPELAIEVISPNDLYVEVVKKLHEYFHYGVQEVWQINPQDRTAMIYRDPAQGKLIGSNEVLTTPLLPGLSIPLQEVFSQLVELAENGPEKETEQN